MVTGDDAADSVYARLKAWIEVIMCAVARSGGSQGCGGYLVLKKARLEGILIRNCAASAALFKSASRSRGPISVTRSI